MASENLKISIVKILVSDSMALACLLLPAIIWAIYVGMTYFGLFLNMMARNVAAGEPALFMYLIPTIASVFFLPLFFWRIYYFQRLFSKGLTVSGTIDSLAFFKDRGQINFTYEFAGRRYSSGSAIMKNKTTELFSPGYGIDLVVDPDNPAKVLIKDLFLKR